MPRTMKVLNTVFLIAPVAIAGLFYATFVCGVPLRWPYYEPVIEGAKLDDPGRHLIFPRANQSPRATLQLVPGLSVRTRLGCYPMGRDGTQACSFQARFFNNTGGAVSFADQPVTVRDEDGNELINLDFYIRFADRPARHASPEIRDGEVFVEFSDSLSLMLAQTDLPERFVVELPNLIVDAERIEMPPIAFVRHDNLTCVGLLANY